MIRQLRSPFRFEPLDKRLLMAVATVDFGDAHQTIDGFGTSSAWMWGSIPQVALDQLYNRQPTRACPCSAPASRPRADRAGGR